MDRVSIADMTMKQSRRGVEFALSFREKIELAKLLDRLGVSVIEVTPILNPKIDSLLIKSISSAVRESTVAVPVGIDPALPETAWKALAEALHPRLQVDAPVSAAVICSPISSYLIYSGLLRGSVNPVAAATPLRRSPSLPAALLDAGTAGVTLTLELLSANLISSKD